jgi:nuclear pore complex protein Nup160
VLIDLWFGCYPLLFFQTNKAGNKISWGMSGKEADPAALFRLYINYGRHAEATNLLVEYLESFASSVMDRPTEIQMQDLYNLNI